MGLLNFLMPGDGVNLQTSVIALVFAFVLVIFTNILLQVFHIRPSEPPLVFHWLPIIGSTVVYGVEPFKFFTSCQAKVCRDMILIRIITLT